ncbi:MAG TPA: hypothetical protein ENH85_06885 [Candidatus Scalindua sp.]|nr:hypothetical protein [Candidatus Scalindua sp.]
MTIEEFNELSDGEIFDYGILPNSPEGLFMTNDGGELKWVATKGYGDDWSIYCHWSDHTEDWIKKYGDKLHNRAHIQLCVECDKEVMGHYRF